jgi:hypothetical protein
MTVKKKLLPGMTNKQAIAAGKSAAERAWGRPTPNDWLAWVVINPAGFPILESVSDRRGGAIAQVSEGYRMINWPEARKLGYRVIRVKLIPRV